MIPNHEKKRDYYVNQCLSQLKYELEFSKWQEEEFLLRNQGINIIYPNEENVFMMPNYEIK